VVVDADMDELPADAARAALALAVAGDAMTGAREAAELLDVDMQAIAGVLALVVPGRLGRLERLRQKRFKTRLAVADETPDAAAMALAVRRWRRNASICAITGCGVGLTPAACAMASGVSRSFLCTFIRFLVGHRSFANLSIQRRDRTNNLLKAHN
jgi:hypothetical protein